MNKIMIAGNWKLHMNVSESSRLLQKLHENIKIHNDVEVVIAPAMLSLQPLSLQVDRRKFRLASQNAFYADEGAFTGEVSFKMLRGIAHYGIIGHSDRRHKFGESLDDVSQKVVAAVRNGIVPIICVGETTTERLAKETKLVLHDQVTTALKHLTKQQVADCVIAYEPVWAISNGHSFRDTELPTPDVIAKAAEIIRTNISALYGEKTAKQVRILYGGSAHSGNAKSLINTDGIDGLLVGGASMNYTEFSKIVDSAVVIASANKAAGK